MIVASGAFGSGRGSASDRVETTKGAVEGFAREGGVRAFLGIPFAEPPVGELRWKPPRPASRWEGVRPAKAFAPAPMQAALVSLMMGAPAEFSEDCLYLNVWTPAKGPGERLPVMVWIYGGAFAMGGTNAPVYDGARLAEKGVVVVSVAYRVGPFGFLAHPELSREGGGRSGNYGLLDQVAALEWVRDEVAAFGGDPGRVTLFGESAGGISVSMLAASPRAAGLFHRAISQSGGSFGPARYADEGGQAVRPLRIAEEEGVRLLADLGADDLAAGRALPAADLLGRPRLWWPNFDGDVLPGDQFELYREGRFHDTPILVGSNSDEGAMFVRAGASTTPKAFEALVRKGFGEHAGAILAAYPHATPDEAFRATKDLLRDTAFGWHTWAWARLQTERGRNPAFVYYFDRRTPRTPEGASHADEIPFVFRNLDAQGGLFRRGPAPDDAAASDLISTLWVNFARTGDPNGEGLPAWPPFDPDAPQALHLDAAPSARPYPNLPQLQALDAYYAWRRERAKTAP